MDLPATVRSGPGFLPDPCDGDEGGGPFRPDRDRPRVDCPRIPVKGDGIPLPEHHVPDDAPVPGSVDREIGVGCHQWHVEVGVAGVVVDSLRTDQDEVGQVVRERLEAVQ